MTQLRQTSKLKREPFKCSTLQGIATIEYVQSYIENKPHQKTQRNCLNIDHCGVLKELPAGALEYNWDICPMKDFLTR